MPIKGIIVRMTNFSELGTLLPKLINAPEFSIFSKMILPLITSNGELYVRYLLATFFEIWSHPIITTRIESIRVILKINFIIVLFLPLIAFLICD